MAYSYSRPLFLSLGLLANDSYRHYAEEHFPRRNKCIISIPHRDFRIGIMLVPICYGMAYWKVFQFVDRVWSGFRSEEHGFCYLDSGYLLASAFYRRARLLYSLAEYHQFYRDMASEEEVEK